VPLSTSSSDARCPVWPWRTTWLPALVLAGLALAAWEAGWRCRGYRPSLKADADLWCQLRDAAARGDANTVVLLGASRMQYGGSPRVLAEACPGYRVVLLAYGGHYALPTLQALADDERFRGAVVYSLTPSWLIPSAFEASQATLLSYYRHDWNWCKQADRVLRTAVQSHVVLVQPALSVQELLRRWLQREAIGPQEIVDHPDGSRTIAVRGNPRAERERRDGNFRWYSFLTRRGAEQTTYEQWLGYVEQLNAAVRRIQAHGGSVVLLRMPSSGPVRDIEERFFPRARYWDVLAHTTPAIAIHSDDVPALARFVAVDWAHLDAQDVPRFTRLLADELRRRGVLAPQPSPGPTAP
jgi:hypothetical protein